MDTWVASAFLTAMDNTTTNMGVQISLQETLLFYRPCI